MNYLDRNEFNYAPSQEVVEALKNFDINKLCFYTRIYDEGKKSILSVYLSESYGIDEPQVLLGYGGEDILKQAVHYFLTQEDGNKTMLIHQPCYIPVMRIRFQCGNSNILRDTVITQIFVAVFAKVGQLLTHKPKTHAQSGQSVELGKRA